MNRVLGPAFALLVLAPLAGAAPGRAASIVRHEVSASLDVPANRIDVVDVIRLSPPRPGRPLHFLLHRDLAVREIALSAEGVLLEWEARAGWDPRNFWRRPPYGELDGHEIAREVRVEEPSRGWPGGVFSLRVAYGGVIADSLQSPERAYGRSFETTTGRIVDRGAFLAGGTFWVPWAGEDLFAFDLTVDTPAEWRVVSQGAPGGEEVRGTRRRTRWTSPDPMDEIYLIAGPYELRERDHGGVRIQAFTYADTGPEIVDPYLDATGPILDRYAERFGPYPYPKFALVENYWQTGYGMPSFTFLGDRVIRLPFIVSTSYPHEILHNWWGNGVYLRPGEGNWCEGLTTYGADYLAKEEESEQAARDYRRSTLQGYRDFAVAGGQDFALRNFRERDSAATQAVGYGKTFMVFHMLRRSLGDEAFLAALRRFYLENRFRRAGWDELRAAFEDEMGAPQDALFAFFEQWVDRPGAPVLRLEGVSVESLDEGSVLVRGEITQEEPGFRLSVPLVVEGEGEGERQQASVEVREERPSAFELPVSFTPTRVSVDPDFEVLRLLHAEEVPAALSGVLGAQQVRVVLGSAVEGELRDALRAVAEEWAGDSTVTMVEETAGQPLPDFEGGTWLFGEGDRARELERELWPDPAARGAGSIVAAGREAAPDPAMEARPLGLFLPESADVVAALARKIQHYSKYSWLRFEGATNVDKGLWEAGSSPLSVNLR